MLFMCGCYAELPLSTVVTSLRNRWESDPERTHTSPNHIGLKVYNCHIYYAYARENIQ